MKKIVIALGLISIVACNQKKGRKEENVFISIKNAGGGYGQAQRAKRIKIDTTFNLYGIFYKSDSFRDGKGKPIYDSIKKAYRIYPDTTVYFDINNAIEVNPKYLDTSKIK